MDKKKIQIILLIVGVIILMLMLFSPKTKRRAVNRHMPVVASKDSVTQIFNEYDQNVTLLADKEIDDSLAEMIQQKAQESWQRNPFELKVKTKIEVEAVEEEVEEVVVPTEPVFTVNGIIMDPGGMDSTIMIDGDLYKVGDTIDGWKLVILEADRAVFKNSGVEYIYQRYEEYE